MNQSVSVKMTAIGFIASILVVVIHTNFSLGRLFVPLLTQWAVPYFLIASGALYSRTLSSHSLYYIVRSKIYTLVLPYIIFSVWGALFIKVRNVPEMFGLLNGYPSGNQPLWFIRQLLLSMFAIMALQLTFQRVRNQSFRKLGISICYVICFIVLDKILGLIAMPASPYYFLIGWFLSDSLLRGSILKSDRCKCMTIALSCFIMACLIRFAFLDYSKVEVLARNIGNILIIASIWIGWDVVVGIKMIELPKFTKTAFGVYCIHYPPLFLLRDVLPSWLLVLTFPIVCILFISALKMVFPCISKIILGGR